MKNINLSESQIIELEKLKKEYQAKHKVFRRLQVIELRNNKIKPKEIFKLLSVSADSITDWSNIYLEKGFAGLCNFNYTGRSVSEFEQYKDDILELIDHNIYDTYIKLYHDLAQKYTLKNKQNALFKFCKKIGI